MRFLLVVNGTNQISGIKRKRAKAIRKANASVEKLPGEQKAAEVSIKALSKPKTRYTERYDAVSSSDWLAVALKEHCHSEDGSDIGKFECVLKGNDIDLEHRPGNSRLDRKVSYERTPKASSSRAKTDTSSEW